MSLQTAGAWGGGCGVPVTIAPNFMPGAVMGDGAPDCGIGYRCGMRYSVDPADTDAYLAYVLAKQQADDAGKKIVVRFGGVVLDSAITADEEKGEVIFYERDVNGVILSLDGKCVERVKLRGKVTITIE